MIAITLDVTLEQEAFTLHVRESSSVEVLGLFGPSGSGKTSLLESIAGLRRPDAGEIRIAGRLLFSSAAGIDLPARDRHIGYVPQDALLFPHMDVRANITYGSPSTSLRAGRETGTGSRESGVGSRELADGLAPPKPWRRRETGDGARSTFDALVSMLELEPLLGRRIQRLSGGEKQRVAMARALMVQPALLLLDEPLAGVDRERRDRILPYLLRIRRDLHVPLVYVTHDADELTAMADRVLRLESGQVVQAGPPAAVWPAAAR